MKFKVLNTKMTIVVYTAANRSSSIIPQPPFSFSAFLTGGGFTMSKNLKRRNVVTSGNSRIGVKKSGSNIEAYSSTTILRGSFPHSFARLSETKIPTIKSETATMT